MRKTLIQGLLHRTLTEPPPPAGEHGEVILARELHAESQRRLGRSLAIRAVDAGSCNGCELELIALSNAFYDLERYGLGFVASPRHADVLTVTGPVTQNMRQALARTYDAMPHPKWIMAIGNCARDGGVFATSPSCCGGVAAIMPVDIWVTGCPPKPRDMLQGLLTLLRTR